MSKKNTKQLAKRRVQKKEAQRVKAIPRRASYLQSQAAKKAHERDHLRKLKEAMSTLSGGVKVPDISDEDYVFWLCHGANYMVSDADSGLWGPLFEDIYNGQLPDIAMIPTKVMTHFPDAFGEGGDLSGLPMAVLAWTITEKSTMRIMKFEAENRIRRSHAEDPDLDVEAIARQPHQPQVWDLLNQVKSRSMDMEPEVVEEPTEVVEEPFYEEA